eukprot:m.28051 g.28051  ORF g.28051 m.28051 type:complete len:869 (+) comp4479_c0_seq1:119-2725(+)
MEGSSPEMPTVSPTEPETLRYTFVITKNETALGMKAEDADDTDGLITITQIIPGGLVDTAPTEAFIFEPGTAVPKGVGVQPGDQIEEINKQPLMGSGVTQLLALVQRVPLNSKIVFKMRRRIKKKTSRLAAGPRDSISLYNAFDLKSLTLDSHVESAVAALASVASDATSASTTTTAATGTAAPASRGSDGGSAVVVDDTAAAAAAAQKGLGTPDRSVATSGPSQFPAWGAHCGFGPSQWARCVGVGVISSPLDGSGTTHAGVSGKIVVVARKQAGFGHIILSLQKAGAVGAVVIDTTGAPFAPVVPSSEAATSVTIPFVVVSMDDGAKLMAELRSTEGTSHPTMLRLHWDTTPAPIQTQDMESLAPSDAGKKPGFWKRSFSTIKRASSPRSIRKRSVNAVGRDSTSDDTPGAGAAKGSPKPPRRIKTTDSDSARSSRKGSAEPSSSRPHSSTSRVFDTSDGESESPTSTDHPTTAARSVASTHKGGRQQRLDNVNDQGEEAVDEEEGEDEGEGLNSEAEMPSFPGQIVHDSIVNRGVDELYHVLFVDDAWFRELCRLKQTTNLQIGPWEGEDGAKARTLEYTLSLNMRIGPKSTQANETQREIPSDPGCRVVVTECRTPFVPYGSNFYGKNFFVLARESKYQTHLRVYGEVVITASLWSITRNLIVSNAKEGMTNHWIDASRALLTVLETDEDEQRRPSSLTRRSSARLGLRIRHRRASSGTWVAPSDAESIHHAANKKHHRTVGHQLPTQLSTPSGLGFPFEALTPVAVPVPHGKVSGLESVIRRADLNTLMATYSTLGGIVKYIYAEPYGVAAIMTIGLLAWIATAFMMSINSLVIIYLLYRIWELEHKVKVLAQTIESEPSSPI